jgi:phenylpropionate dioxygenase-like ring-hydroxylating dioxygenase large terminal subunit
MEHSEQIACARRLLGNIENNRTDMAESIFRHDVSDYTSVEQLRAEKEKLYKGYPIFIGFSSDLPNPGDYLTENYVGVPVLVVRARDGGLKAFLNMCSHRAAPVASGCGKGAKRFICPYHGWAYDADGKFLRRTMEEGFVEMDKATLDLQPLAVQEKYGLMWLALSPGLQFDIDGLLHGLGHDFAAYGYNRYVHYRTMVMHKNMNWKMVIDTFLENYHLQVLHRNTIGSAILSHLQLSDAYGDCGRLIQARSTFVNAMKETPEARWDLIKHSAITYTLFPNTFFIMQSDHVEIWRSFPDTDNPNTTKIYFDVYIPEPAETEKARKYWDKNIDYGVSIVLGEDFPLSERSQLAFQSGARDFITFGRNEPGLINYHKAINRALGLEEQRRQARNRCVPGR